MASLNMRGRNFRRQGMSCRFLVLVLFALVFAWLTCFAMLMRGNSSPDAALDGKYLKERKLEAHIVSRSGNVTATADVRGNLGPASVVLQNPPGKDWIHDRWQAASNMHGKAIPGVHWIHLDFGREIIPQNIVLDWEAAYADKYRLEASLKPLTGEMEDGDGWLLFDAMDPTQTSRRAVEEAGQSPGVNTKTPLHVIHTLNPLLSNRPLRYLRLYILKSAMGWGVSLWQLDVTGFEKDEVK